ncbi:MAG: hemerythrin domain-containing protein [Myxococcales bacterium]
MSTPPPGTHLDHLGSAPAEDAVSLLQSHHRAVSLLFAQIQQARAADVKAVLFRQIGDTLAVHAALEEACFYPAVKERRTKGLLLESLEEHLGIKRILADMLDVSVTDPVFDAKLKILRGQVEHHVRDEENLLFPTVRTIFSSDELADLADTMKDELRELDGTEPRLNVRAEMSEATFLP